MIAVGGVMYQAPKCDNCGANLPPPKPNGVVKCSYCATEYKARETIPDSLHHLHKGHSGTFRTVLFLVGLCTIVGFISMLPGLCSQMCSSRDSRSRTSARVKQTERIDRPVGPLIQMQLGQKLDGGFGPSVGTFQDYSFVVPRESQIHIKIRAHGFEVTTTLSDSKGQVIEQRTAYKSRIAKKFPPGTYRLQTKIHDHLRRGRFSIEVLEITPQELTFDRRVSGQADDHLYFEYFFTVTRPGVVDVMVGSRGGRFYVDLLDAQSNVLATAEIANRLRLPVISQALQPGQYTLLLRRHPSYQSSSLRHDVLVSQQPMVTY